MTLRTAFFSVIAVSGVFAGSAAYAGPDFSGSNVNMGFLNVGDSGVITDIYQGLFSIPPNEVAQSLSYGYLPRNSAINFTYHLTSGILAGSTTSQSTYDYHKLGNHYYGSSTNVAGQAPVQQGYVNGVAGVSQVFATANYTQLTATTATAKTQIANYTKGTLDNPKGHRFFNTALVAILLQNPQATGYITYNVSSIPLPAALPMLGAAMAGLFGLSRRRKAAAA